jgi:hypothetical protein
MAGAAVTAVLYLAPVHGSADGKVRDCGSFFSSWGNKSLSPACNSALSDRFFLGLVIVLAAGAAGWGVWGVRRLRSGSGQSTQPVGAPRYDFRVGALIPPRRLDFLSRLAATPEQAVISTTSGTLVIERSMVTAVRADKVAMLSIGITFTTVDGSADGVVAYTRNPDNILAAFSRLGWPVSRLGPARDQSGWPLGRLQ